MRSVKYLGFFGKRLLPLVVVVLLLASPVGTQTTPQCGCPITGGGQPAAPCVSGCPDTDGDGLADDWETARGIDLNCDGILDSNDLLLPGADPDRPDVYLAYDYMEGGGIINDPILGAFAEPSHKPAPEAIEMVVAAFAAHGIALHMQPGPGSPLPHNEVISFGPRDPACPPGTADFYALKAQNFDPKKKFTYRYMIFGHNSCGPESELNGTGAAEIFGNDAIVSLGVALDPGLLPGFARDILARREAGTIMHEMGHNFGLCHGGPCDPAFPDVPRKPNYISVMNYNYQFGIPFSNSPGSTDLAGLRLDYSPVALATLNENALNEAAGVSACSPCPPCPPTGPCPPCPLTDIILYVCPNGRLAAGAGCGPIDWNCRGRINQEPVMADINGDRVLSDLQGFEDWSFIGSHLAFQCFPNFVD